MDKKYSKRIRAEAARILDTCANADRSGVPLELTEQTNDPDIRELALKAFMAYPADFASLDWARECYAGAAAILRDGWSPDDPILDSDGNNVNEEGR